MNLSSNRSFAIHTAGPVSKTGLSCFLFANMLPLGPMRLNNKHVTPRSGWTAIVRCERRCPSEWSPPSDCYWFAYLRICGFENCPVGKKEDGFVRVVRTNPCQFLLAGEGNQTRKLANTQRSRCCQTRDGRNKCFWRLLLGWKTARLLERSPQPCFLQDKPCHGHRYLPIHIYAWAENDCYG